MDPEGNEVSFPANGVEGHFTVLNFLDLSGYPEATHSLLYFPLKHSFVPFFFFLRSGLSVKLCLAYNLSRGPMLVSSLT